MANEIKMNDMKRESMPTPEEQYIKLVDYLERLCSAYRQSYRLLSIINKCILIVSGILSSTAVLAMVPMIPVFIAGVSVIPMILLIINEKVKLSDKVKLLKNQYKQNKLLLTHLKSDIFKNNKDEICSDIWLKSETLIEPPPLEIYLKKYKLNGYK